MANSTRVLDVWSERTDTPRARATAVFRALQGSDDNPKSSPGGRRKAVHWLVQPVVSHAIGVVVSVAEPATEAPKFVKKYRGLRFYDAETKCHSAAPKAGPGHLRFKGDTLGEVLDNIVTDVAKDPSLNKVIEHSHLTIRLWLGRPLASITFDDENGAMVRSDSFVIGREPTIPGLQDAADYWPPAASISYVATLSFATISMLADLLRDTMNHLGSLASPPTGSGTPPGTTNENADAFQGASASSSDRSDGPEGQTHQHTQNGAATSLSMPCVREFVIPGSSDGRAFPQPSRPNGEYDDKSHHAYSAHA